MAKHSYALRPVTKRLRRRSRARSARPNSQSTAWRSHSARMVFMGDHGTPGIELGGLGGSIVLPSPTFVFGNLRRFRRIEKCVRIRKSGISYNCIECNLLDLDHGVLL